MGFFDSIIDEKSVKTATTVTSDTIILDPATNTSSPGSGGTGVTTDDSLIIIDDSPSIAVANTAAEMFSTEASPVNDSVVEFIDDSAVTVEETPKIAETPSVNLMPATESVNDSAIEFTATEELTPTQGIPTIDTNMPATDLLDVNATLERAIADLKANDVRIQEQVQKTLEEEAQLRAEVEKLTSEAESKKVNAEEIRKSGVRTQELIKLFESQIQA